VTAAGQKRLARIANNLRLVRELRQVLLALEDVGIRPLVLKGAALLATVYSIEERAMQDVDLLVPATRYEHAAAALVAGGLTAIPIAGRPVSARVYHSRGFSHDSGVQIDLHGALAPAGRWRVDHAGLFERAVPCDFDGFGGQRLSDEDMVLHLAINLAKDDLACVDRCARDLRRVVDGLAVDWHVVCERAASWGCRTALWVALTLANDRVGAVCSAEVLNRLAPSHIRRRWLDALVDPAAAPPHRLAGKPRHLVQAAFVPVLSDRPIDALRAGGRFVVLRAVDAMAGLLPGALR